jgi:quaternary ammonium compound-resistance protein SugE
MSWLILFFAGLLEVAWAVGLKTHDGRPLILAATVFALVLSIFLLGLAVKQIPISTAYAVWTGIGIVGTVIVGAVSLGEPMPSTKVWWVIVTVVGIVGLEFQH